MSKIHSIALTIIFIVSVFCQNLTSYAILQLQTEMVLEARKTAVWLTDKVHDICRDKIAKENKLKFLKIKLKYLKIVEEKRHEAAAANIVKYANKFVGCPYVWGGNSLSNGCDCSHFVYNVIKDTTDYSGGYTSSRNWANLGKKVPSIEKAQAGDVIVYSGHVAIYDGNGKIILAQSSSTGITNNRNIENANIIAIRRFI